MRCIQITPLSLFAFLCLGIAAQSFAIDERTPESEPQLLEIPNANEYLTEALALGLMRADKVRASAANEHIPTFWSQCLYSGSGNHGRKIGFTFKFMTWELFDLANLQSQQLQFNVHFASGGLPVVDSKGTPGKATFVFKKDDLTVIMMITGIRGPKDGAGRDTELVATYQLVDPSISHQARLEKLMEHPIKHYEEWKSRF